MAKINDPDAVIGAVMLKFCTGCEAIGCIECAAGQAILAARKAIETKKGAILIAQCSNPECERTFTSIWYGRKCPDCDSAVTTKSLESTGTCLFCKEEMYGFHVCPGSVSANAC